MARARGGIDRTCAPAHARLMARPLLIADVAAQLGVSKSRVNALDDKLCPERTPNGTRIYRQDVVDEYAGARAVTRARK